MTWYLLFNTHLFPRGGGGNSPEQPLADEHTATGDRTQLARMYALLGPPPQQLLARPRASEFFHEDGSPKGDKVPNETLKSLLASCIEGLDPRLRQAMTPEEAEMFLAFIRKTVTWTQETRASAEELIRDPWVNK